LLPLAVSPEGHPATAAVPNAIDAVPAQEIQVTAPVLLPDGTEWVPSETLVEGSAATNDVGTSSYIPSPSEELSFSISKSRSPPIAEKESASISPPWHFDSAKLAGLFTGAFLSGASLCLLWILAGHIVLLRIRQTAEAPPEWLAKQYRSLAKQSGIAPPRLIVSPLCARPLTWGVLWPVVVLPKSLCRQENKSQLETILLHELGHIAQQDAQGNLLFCAALPLLYAHPLYWWLRRESQLAAELVADDWAAWQTGKETYVEELVALARCTGKSAIPLVGVTGLFSSPSLFYRRMQMLLAREKPLSTKTSLPWRLASLSALAGAVALAASLAGVCPAVGQTEPPANTPAPAFTPPAAAPGTTPPATEPLPAAAPPAGVRFTKPAAPAAAEPAPADATPAPPATPPDLGRPRTAKEEEALLQDNLRLLEIKQLQDKLRDLQSKPSNTKQPAGIGVSPAQPGANQIQIIRRDDKGGAWLETWTTDGDGRPAKIISTSKKSDKQSQPTTASFSRDGKTITEEIIENDGSRRTIVLDAATGKVVTETRHRNKQNFPTPIVSDNPVGVPAIKPAPASLNYGSPLPANDPNQARGTEQLDLITLATSYADAVGAVEVAEAKMKEVADLSDRKVISQQEVNLAKLALSAAKRKEQLLRSIAEVAAASAAQEYERTTQLYKSGASTGSAATESRTRLDILKQILGTRPPEATPAKP
jgi:beta-lactamase regulating signal transducer with metallopeptidase domain